MKHKVYFLTLFFFALTQLSAQKKKEVQLTYHSKIPFEKIYKAGEKLRLVQLCTTTSDSVVSGTVTFKKASVSGIQSCEMSMRLIADTIREYHIKTTKAKNTEQLINEVFDVYGKPHDLSLHEGITRYSWTDAFNTRFIKSALTVNEKKKTAEFSAKIE
jgi:hypothetical protein